MLTLGIETSCDETSASVVYDDQDVLSNKIASSLDLHKKYGGVIPEIACRHHLEVINFVIDDALEAAGVSSSELDLVAVTQGPGLSGALLVGMSTAKALSFALDIPLIGVNHLYAHLYSALIYNKHIKFPCIGLVISGGHTILVKIENYSQLNILGQTRDDAAGEAFDKAAKILNLGYPGGPAIEQKAIKGDANAINFPKAYLEKDSLDFSFSGVKTSLLYHVKKLTSDERRATSDDICASFQKAIFDVVTDKTILACNKNNMNQLIVGGGVCVNKNFQTMLNKKAADYNIEVFFPGIGLGTDNAAMVAAAGYRLYTEGIRSDYSIDAEPNLSLT